jgi:hypothetical protein
MARRSAEATFFREIQSSEGFASGESGKVDDIVSSFASSVIPPFFTGEIAVAPVTADDNDNSLFSSDLTDSCRRVIPTAKEGRYCGNDDLGDRGTFMETE